MKLKKREFEERNFPSQKPKTKHTTLKFELIMSENFICYTKAFSFVCVVIANISSIGLYHAFLFLLHLKNTIIEVKIILGRQFRVEIDCRCGI